MATTARIIQTGRLGDLWFTTPLAAWLHARSGEPVEVVYDAVYGHPFRFFPYIRACPVDLPRIFRRNRGVGHVINELAWQWRLVREGSRDGREVHFNQVFPLGWVQAHLRGRAYVEHWYRRYPDINFRRAPSTLKVTSSDTLLVFRNSASISFRESPGWHDWIDGNVDRVCEQTGFRPLAVAYGDQPDHPRYETWRGSLEDYQQLIAGCGMVFGISTSAHVLALLLGKPLVALYRKNQSVVDTIGDTPQLREGEEITPARIAEALEVAS